MWNVQKLFTFWFCVLFGTIANDFMCVVVDMRIQQLSFNHYSKKRQKAERKVDELLEKHLGVQVKKWGVI